MQSSDRSTRQIFSDVITARRSVRAFTNQPIDADTLKTIFTLAQTAPSNCNRQPWMIHVASGDAIQRLKSALLKAAEHEQTSLDFPFTQRYPGVYQDRQFDSAQQLYGSVNVGREDKAQRHQVFIKNFEFFDAPHAAFLFMPKQFGIREAADVGMYAQNLMLALTAFGLASCPQTSLGFYADTIREVLNINEDNKLLFGISFGYEDKTAAINTCRVGRAPLEETTFFHQ